MQTVPRNQTRFPGGCSSELNTTETETEKQSRLNFVCFVNHKASAVCILKAPDAVDYKVGRLSLILEKRQGSCSAQSPVQSGEKPHFLKLFSFYHCSHLQLSRGGDASVTS